LIYLGCIAVLGPNGSRIVDQACAADRLTGREGCWGGKPVQPTRRLKQPSICSEEALRRSPPSMLEPVTSFADRGIRKKRLAPKKTAMIQHATTPTEIR